jgi:hypothetical protein
LRTIVYFRPGANATYAGDIAEIEIRDDLPAPAAAIKAVAAPGTTNQPEKPVPHQFMQN